MSAAPRGRAQAGKRPSGPARLVLWLGLAAVLAHTFIIAVWAGPTTPVRTMIGPENIRGYVLPVYEQAWRIFAPTPRRVAVSLEIRAEYIDPATGETMQTGWIDMVDGEDAMIVGNPFPPRLSLAARRVSNHLYDVVGDLNDDQRELINAHYLTTPVSELGSGLMDRTDGSVAAGVVGRYMTYDAAATHLATLYYTAYLGEDIELLHVQFRVGQRFVPTWEPGAPGDVDDAETQWRTMGWRPATELGENELELFSSYLEASGALR